jgi:hypothetical protein
MITGKKISIIILLLSFCTLMAQTTEYLIVDAPIGTQAASKVLWVKWAGLARPGFPAPDSGIIRYDRAPGGGNISNYRYQISNPWIDTLTKLPQSNILDVSGSVRKRGTAFKASDQPGMGFGVFYCVVAFPYTLGLIKDTLVSNEFVLMIESPNAVDWIGPKDNISDLTPTFQWNANSGVPYYHVILSDDAIKVDSSAGDVNLSGLSIIWQAITPNTQIVYGAPDPSKTITADPPPLSPGKRYTWLVLNNYGNHPAFSSTKIKLPPGEFAVLGKTLNKPKATYPGSVTLNSRDNGTFTFKWTNLDTLANTYKIYVYVASDFEGIDAKLVVWQKEVMGKSNVKVTDTLSCDIDASSVLTSNNYSWRVIAVDSRGAGSVGDTLGFKYSAPSGNLNIHTRELIRVPNENGGVTTVENKVGLVEIKVEVLDGSLEAPLLFYTDNNGYLSRKRPTGAYRITAIKNEFESQTKTITIQENQTLEQTFYLERPEATVYGKIIDESNKGINLVKVYGISDLGDTLTTNTDALGNFILKCNASDWRIWSEMTGYKTVLPSKVTVTSGQNLNFGTIVMNKNPYTLSGVVKNSSGDPLLGVKVTVLRDGVLIDQMPSTPQTGTFSFSLLPGTYTILTEKTGFTSSSFTVDLLSSKTITANMEPGATVVTGYIYGKTWVASRNEYVLAPITNASVKFVRSGTTDTVSVKTDATYGDFKVSIKGGFNYTLLSSATGYVRTSTPQIVEVPIGTNKTVYDTLNGFASISGSVVLKTGNTAIGGCNVNILKIPERNIIASAKSAVDGKFEIRNIPDGVYLINAGKDGYVQDSIAGGDSLQVADGKCNRSTLNFFLKPGNKVIKWYAANDGVVKIQSPIVKTLTLTDSLNMAGPGYYVVNFDAKADSIIDCSYRKFRVYDSETVHIDTIKLLMKHVRKDSLMPVGGTIPLVVTASDSLDSLTVYYKDAGATDFISAKPSKENLTYKFNIIPSKDGSVMVYYFKGYKDNDIYGYEKEVFNVFVKPDTTRLSRFEIIPSSKDTLKYPSSYDAVFGLKGYYSSAFIESKSIDPQSIVWSIQNAQGCKLSNTTGLTATLVTGSIKTVTPIILIAKIDTTKTKLTQNIACSVTVAINISGSKLKQIKVKRTDSKNPNPISSSTVDRAEFQAEGIDEAGNVLKISPAWSIIPTLAGTISADGVFRPSQKFVGKVRIYATSGNVKAEYAIDEKSEPGLSVRFMIVNKTVPDTATNGSGCMIIFPPNIVSNNDIGLIDLRQVSIENRIKLESGIYYTVSRTLYDVKQLENVALNTASDSIRLSIALPDNFEVGNRKMYIANWLEDSLKWQVLPNSVLNSDKKSVSAKLGHFSEYTILTTGDNSGYLAVSPNPFSPFVNYGQVDPSRPYYGTAIKFRLEVGDNQIVQEAKLQIYNIVGDLVWSAVINNLKKSTYEIWWDGRSSSRQQILSEQGSAGVSADGNLIIVTKGEKLCRNGRYFAVLLAKDSNNKTHRYMKQIVMLK